MRHGWGAGEEFARKRRRRGRGHARGRFREGSRHRGRAVLHLRWVSCAKRGAATGGAGAGDRASGGRLQRPRRGRVAAYEVVIASAASTPVEVLRVAST